MGKPITTPGPRKMDCGHESRVAVDIHVGSDPFTGRDKFKTACPTCAQRVWFAISR